MVQSGIYSKCVEWQVRVGTQNLQEDVSSSYKVETWTIHPLYESPKGYYDVAVIKLRGDLTFHDKLAPICLPEAIEPDADHLSGDLVTFTGWGMTSYETINNSDELQRTVLSIYPQSHCNKTHDIRGDSNLANVIATSMPDLFQSSVLCAGYEVGGYGSCYGDSGGPLVKLDLTGDIPHYGPEEPVITDLGIT